MSLEGIQTDTGKQSLSDEVYLWKGRAALHGRRPQTGDRTRRRPAGAVEVLRATHDAFRAVQEVPRRSPRVPGGTEFEVEQFVGLRFRELVDGGRVELSDT